MLGCLGPWSWSSGFGVSAPRVASSRALVRNRFAQVRGFLGASFFRHMS